MDFFFLYLDCVLFLTTKIKNNKIENEKKFMNVRFYGEKPSTVIAPSKKGIKYITKNLLFNKVFKKTYYYVIEFKILFSILFILK